MGRAFSEKMARAEYKAKHWGESGSRGSERLRVPTADGHLVLLGELVAVTYRTVKFGDGDSDYEHKFKGPRPRLVYNAAGGLIIAGGKYRIDDRGIIG
ncbi:MAG: hypothetical protein ACHQQR_00780 [Gemmatimonadales bacterium]